MKDRKESDGLIGEGWNGSMLVFGARREREWNEEEENCMLEIESC